MSLSCQDYLDQEKSYWESRIQANRTTVQQAQNHQLQAMLSNPQQAWNLAGLTGSAYVAVSVQPSVSENPSLAKTFVKRSPEETWLRTRVHEICWNPS